MTQPASQRIRCTTSTYRHFITHVFYTRMIWVWRNDLFRHYPTLLFFFVSPLLLPAPLPSSLILSPPPVFFLLSPVDPLSLCCVFDFGVLMVDAVDLLTPNIFFTTDCSRTRASSTGTTPSTRAISSLCTAGGTSCGMGVMVVVSAGTFAVFLVVVSRSLQETKTNTRASLVGKLFLSNTFRLTYPVRERQVCSCQCHEKNVDGVGLYSRWLVGWLIDWLIDHQRDIWKVLTRGFWSLN